MIAEAAEMRPDHMAPWIAPIASSTTRFVTSPYAIEKQMNPIEL